MLYKNKGKELNLGLFRSPTAEYRGTPFWVWNCELDREQVLWQVDYFKERGFGGFHMHSRVGMAPIAGALWGICGSTNINLKIW